MPKEKISKARGVLISGLDSGGLGGAEIISYKVGSRLYKYNFWVEYSAVYQSALLNYLNKHRVKLRIIPIRMDIVGNLRGFIKFFFFLPFFLIYTSIMLADFKRRRGKYVILGGFSDRIIFTPICKLLNLKVIWNIQSPFGYLEKRLLGIPYQLNRLVSYYCDLIITPSLYIKDKITDKVKVDKKNIKVIANGTEIYKTGQLKKLSIEGNKLKSVYKLENKFILGFVSRIQEGKGLDLVLKSVLILKKEIPNLALLIVGGGEIDKMKELAGKLGILDICVFTGYTDKPLAAMSTFDVMVFPSTWELEGFGIVLIEAMSVGTPIVAANFGPIPEVLGEAGILVNPDLQSISKAVVNLYKHKSLREKYKIAGLQRAKLFDIEKTALKYAEALNSL